MNCKNSKDLDLIKLLASLSQGILSSLINRTKLIQIDKFILNFYSLFLKRTRLNLKTKYIMAYRFKRISNTI